MQKQTAFWGIRGHQDHNPPESQGKQVMAAQVRVANPEAEERQVQDDYQGKVP